ncbi:hypothetical protein [Amycolatopsis sp. WGS_07]|uniref:nSTAND1 domain-containing NTPase n=1 Tax=Amycolatopsis sp. WGS_07 TaxID=3076764 RepID=UPI0038731A22
MPRRERPLDPGGDALSRFAQGLRDLREKAGNPTYRELARRAHYSAGTLSDAAGGRKLPTLPVTLAYVRACSGDVSAWEENWHSLAAELAEEDAEPGEQDSADDAPYVGLRAFRTEDADRFFGRERVLEELEDKLSRRRFLAVFGPSGAGKSSLLRAGFVPRRADSVTVLFTPGLHPFEECALRLAPLLSTTAAQVLEELTSAPGNLRLLLRQAGRDRTALVVIDQFEELFTLCSDPAERTAFLDALLDAATPGAAEVVIGVRADFYPRCAEHRGLAEAVSGEHLLLGPMSAGELRDAIVKPATRAGLSVESALVAELVAEAHSEPGVLPLLSHVLLETWHRRQGVALTLAAYDRTGRLEHALTRTAESVYSSLDAEQQIVLRHVLLRLTALGDGTDDTRRRVPLPELTADPDHVAVLDELICARLVTVDRDTVELAHEALIRQWPRLRGWLAEDRQGLEIHRQLTLAAAAWEALGRDTGSLYRGRRLEIALAWSTRDGRAPIREAPNLAWNEHGTEQLNDLEREFLAASARERDRERLAKRRRVRIALTSLSAALVVVLALATIALVQAEQARQQRDQALADKLVSAAKAQLLSDPELSVLLARRALEIAPSAQGESALAQAMADSHVRSAWQTEQGQSIGVAFSPDGKWLASAGHDHTVRVRAVAGDRAPLVLRGHTDRVLDVAFSPDGSKLASVSQDGTVRIWRTDGTGAPTVLRGPKTYVHAVSWHPDGQRLATGSEDGAVRVWRSDGTGEPVVLTRHPSRALTVAFSPDGARLASGSGDSTIRVLDTATGTTLTTLTGHTSSVEDLAFGPDGQRIVSGSTDGTMRVWRIDGTAAPIVFSDHQDTVETVAFSHDGRHVVSGGNDRTARIHRAAGGGDPVVLRGNGGPIWSVAFSPDDRVVATGGDEGVVRLWESAAKPGQRTLDGHNGAAWNTAFSPDGTRVAAACDDGTVRIQQTDGRGAPVLLTGHRGAVEAVAFSPDGQWLVSGGDDRTVRIWRAGGEPVRTMTGHQGRVWSVAVSPDGTHIVSGSDDRTVRIWPVTGDAAPVVLPTGAGAARDVAYSPDGGRVASGNRNGSAEVWNLADSGRPVVLPTGHEGVVWSIAFSPDGADLAGASNDGTVRVWHAAGDPAPMVLTGHEGLVWNLSFSPDGQRLATAGNDHTVRVWRRAPAVDPITFTGRGASFESASYGPGNQLAAGRNDGTVDVWTCEECVPLDQLLALAAHRVTRDFTPAERQRYLD